MLINNDLKKVLGGCLYDIYKSYVRCMNRGDLAGAADDAEDFKKWSGESIYKYVERR